jgi:hypothetical protein
MIEKEVSSRKRANGGGHRLRDQFHLRYSRRTSAPGRGYEMIAFHANGWGNGHGGIDRQGFIAGVIDFTTHEIADEMFGGYCRGIGRRAGNSRPMGIPRVVPGGLDNAVFSLLPHAGSPEREKTHSHDIRFCVGWDQRDESVC